MKYEDLVSNLQSELEAFQAIYSTRPIKDNSGGMGFNHSFALWKMLRLLKPELVVESGIWKGHSTWLIEIAVPNTKIISFDPDLSMRQYISPNVIYAENDFQYYDWSRENLEHSLIFFDDHQNSYSRILLAYFFGFKKIIFEDNYSINQGDFYSLIHLFSNSGFPDIQMSKNHRKSLRTIVKRAWYMPVLRRIGSHQNWIVAENTFDSKNIKNRMSQMLTFPRILESDGTVANEFVDSAPDFIVQNFINKNEFTYNNFTFLELK